MWAGTLVFGSKAMVGRWRYVATLQRSFSASEKDEVRAAICLIRSRIGTRADAGGASLGASGVTLAAGGGTSTILGFGRCLRGRVLSLLSKSRGNKTSVTAVAWQKGFFGS